MRKVIKSICSLVLVLMFCASGAYATGAIIGTVATTMTAIIYPTAMSAESTLGNYVADSARHVMETDISIINGGEFYANLCGGDITEEDVRFLFEEDRQLAVAQISPQQLKAILEEAFSYVVMSPEEQIDYEASEYGGYPQISGITVCLDVSAPVGERVRSIVLSDTGEELDMFSDDVSVSLVATDYMMHGGYGLPQLEHQDTEITIVDVVLKTISEADGNIHSPGKGRIKIIGTNEQWLFEYVPKFALVLILMFFMFSKSFSKGLQLEKRPTR